MIPKLKDLSVLEAELVKLHDKVEGDETISAYVIKSIKQSLDDTRRFLKVREFELAE